MATLRTAVILGLGFTLCCAATVQAQGKKLYRWTDAQGNVHYTDQLPPEAATAAREQLNNQGIAVDRVERALTPEERAAKAEEAERLAVEARRLEEIRKMDAVLMASYPAESDLARAYKERFDLIEQSVESARVGIRSQEKSLADMLAHAASLERSGKAVPDSVVQSINATRAQVEQQRGYLVKREGERAELQAEFDRLLARHRELRGIKPAASAAGAEPAAAAAAPAARPDAGG